MRYLAEAFALGALRRGQSVEQFLGPTGSPERPGIRYVEVRATTSRYEVLLHTVEDVGHETFMDLVEFPPLDPDNDEEEEFGRLVSITDDPLAALTAAEELTGAVRSRWVNTTMVQDEYSDFVEAGRPARHSPDGHPWPEPSANR
ncbi:hypothetical protein ACFTZF_50660 [Streptomyces mirabilis]|uniref:hypothetical protein n=1 Tax=Streptomyces mirabilis TaxID=68239 RepID=UPI00363C2BE6